LLAGAALLAGGCGGPRPSFLDARPGQGGEVRATVTRPGLSRILVSRPRATPPWKRLVLGNCGPGILRAIKLWDLAGGEDTLIVKGKEEREAGFTPFSLLPDERFVCMADEAEAGPGVLKGAFYWEMPPAAGRIQASLRLRNAEVGAGRVTLKPAGGEAWLELHFDAPMPHTAARLAWQTRSATSRAQVWINTEGGVWARLPETRTIVGWLNPLDLSTSARGQRRLWIRLAYAPSQEGHGEAGAGGPPTLTITRIRVERECKGPGSLRKWRQGLNELSLQFTAAQEPRLDVQLLND